MTHIEKFKLIFEKHQLPVLLILRALNDAGGEIAPQKAITEILMPIFQENHLPELKNDGKTIFEYIRRYESLGFFERTVNTTNRSQNILRLTDLGRELLAKLDEEIEIAQANLQASTDFNASSSRWSQRTLFRVESDLRMSRILKTTSEISLDELCTRTIQVAKESYGLTKLAREATAEELLRVVFNTRFSPSEIEINEERRVVKIKSYL